MISLDQEYVSDLELYDFRNRMYQPELGRFLQPDPKEFGAGDYNLYRYCHNDPVNRIDPTGLEEFDLSDFLTGGLDGASFGLGSDNGQNETINSEDESYQSGLRHGRTLGR